MISAGLELDFAAATKFAHVAESEHEAFASQLTQVASCLNERVLDRIDVEVDVAGGTQSAVVLLYGPKGCGKSSLLAGWFARLEDQVTGGNLDSLLQSSRELARSPSSLSVSTASSNKTFGKRRGNRSTLLFQHYSLSGKESVKVSNLLFRLLVAIKEAFGLSSKFIVKSTLNELVKDLPRFLEAPGRTKQTKIVLVIDDIEHLEDDNGHKLNPVAWLPRQLPSYVRVICSCSQRKMQKRDTYWRQIRKVQGDDIEEAKLEKTNDAIHYSRHRTWQEMERRGAAFIEATDSFGLPLLKQLFSSIVYYGMGPFWSEELQERYQSVAGSRSPLYFFTVHFTMQTIYSLRTTTASELQEYLSTLISLRKAEQVMGKALEIFESLIERREDKADTGVLGHALVLIAVSHMGLTTVELFQLLRRALPSENLRNEILNEKLRKDMEEIIRGLCYQSRGGLWRFRNKSIEKVVLERYAGSAETSRIVDEEELLEYHKDLAKFFSKTRPGSRKVEELMYHLERVGWWMRMRDALLDMSFFNYLWAAPHLRNMLLYFWNKLLQRPSMDLVTELHLDPVEGYSDRLRELSSKQRDAALRDLLDFFYALSKTSAGANTAPLQRPGVPPEIFHSLRLPVDVVFKWSEERASTELSEMQSLPSSHTQHSYNFFLRWLWCHFPRYVVTAFDKSAAQAEKSNAQPKKTKRRQKRPPGDKANKKTDKLSTDAQNSDAKSKTSPPNETQELQSEISILPKVEPKNHRRASSGAGMMHSQTTKQIMPKLCERKPQHLLLEEQIDTMASDVIRLKEELNALRSVAMEKEAKLQQLQNEAQVGDAKQSEDLSFQIRLEELADKYNKMEEAILEQTLFRAHIENLYNLCMEFSPTSPVILKATEAMVATQRRKRKNVENEWKKALESKEETTNLLADMRKVVQEGRENRSKGLRNLQTEVDFVQAQQALEEEVRRRREQVRKQIKEELARQMASSENKSSMQTAMTREEKQACKAKARRWQETWTRVSRRFGSEISDFDSFFDAWEERHELQKRLETQIETLEERLVFLRDLLEQRHEQMQDHLLEEEALPHNTHERLLDLDKHIDSAKDRKLRFNNNFEYLSKLLVDARTGAIQLANMVGVVNLTGWSTETILTVTTNVLLHLQKSTSQLSAGEAALSQQTQLKEAQSSIPAEEDTSLGIFRGSQREQQQQPQNQQKKETNFARKEKMMSFWYKLTQLSTPQDKAQRRVSYVSKEGIDPVAFLRAIEFAHRAHIAGLKDHFADQKSVVRKQIASSSRIGEDDAEVEEAEEQQDGESLSPVDDDNASIKDESRVNIKERPKSKPKDTKGRAKEKRKKVESTLDASTVEDNVSQILANKKEESEPESPDSYQSEGEMYMSRRELKEASQLAEERLRGREEEKIVTAGGLGTMKRKKTKAV